MKKIGFVTFSLLFIAYYATAQSSMISGAVKDEKGAPLHFVFIEDAQYKNAAFSDSTGNFSIAIHPDSKLKFSQKGYKDAEVAPSASMQVTLKQGEGSLGATHDNVSAQLTQSRGNSQMATIGDGGVIAPAHQKGNVHGSQYLFDTFAHGYIVMSSGSLAYDSNDLFDYDKMGGTLLFTSDGSTIKELGWDQIASFTLFSKHDERFDFEKVPAINNSHFIQVLSSGKKYKVYKLIKTKFVKSDYVNNGVTSHGNDYDEYVDDADYFVFDVQSNQMQKLSLKKKSIKEDFAKEADKVNKYLSDNSGSINDAYLAKLGDYMNQ